MPEAVHGASSRMASKGRPSHQVSGWAASAAWVLAFRPSLVRDRQAYLDRIARVSAMADIIKLSDEDLAWITGGTDVEAFARTKIDHGAKILRGDGSGAHRGFDMTGVRTLLAT